MIMDKYRNSLLFQCLIFLIPLNIYMWGDYMLANLQWALFRYQVTEYGNSLILGNKDISYMYLGLNTGLFNVAAASLWAIGTIILFIGLIITIYGYIEEESSLLKSASLLTIGGGITLGLSALCRFNGGFAIPIGVPVILLIGWWIYQENNEDEDDEDDEMEPVNVSAELSDSR
jgi:hypothetical protein